MKTEMYIKNRSLYTVSTAFIGNKVFRFDMYCFDFANIEIIR